MNANGPRLPNSGDVKLKETELTMTQAFALATEIEAAGVPVATVYRCTPGGALGGPGDPWRVVPCMPDGTRPSVDSVAQWRRYRGTTATMYAAGYRDSRGGMAMFAGPTPNLEWLMGFEPEEDRKAYIVALAEVPGGTEPTLEPVARWHGGRWQRKPGA